MKKFILFFVLAILFVAFGAFLINAYQLQKNYFQSKVDSTETEEPASTSEVAKPSFYKDYAKEYYDQAIADKSTLVLYFTSNWCKECIDQDSANSEAFNGLTVGGVVGLKIHILDSETTTETDALAKKFGVSKEQTFVIVDKKGAVAFKQTGAVSKELLNQKIMEVK
jgi:thiol:disulfide interchange protein